MIRWSGSGLVHIFGPPSLSFRARHFFPIAARLSERSSRADHTPLRSSQTSQTLVGRTDTQSVGGGAFGPRILPMALMMCSGPKGLRMVEVAPA